MGGTVNRQRWTPASPAALHSVYTAEGMVKGTPRELVRTVHADQLRFQGGIYRAERLS